jgi:D-alanyl-lipoteichoic acid acyltransferase DltB (MBOAT superfamily)
MSLASLGFLAFAVAIAAFYNLFDRRAWRQGVLLVANVCFLGTFSTHWKLFLPLVAFLMFGFIAVRTMLNRRLRNAFIPFVVLIIALFVWLKKYTFIPASDFLQFPYVTIGLSYVFFRVLHLISDAHDANLPDQVGPVAYLNYTLNFTTLVAGPIQRYEDFASTQLSQVRTTLTLTMMARAVERICLGFFKLRVLSLVLPMFHTIALHQLSSDQPVRTRVTTGVVIAVAYAFYLYFNFSGYTDLMIGVARFLRLELPENFNRPFSSFSFIEFWSRWHITLSMWLKTYLYTPFLKAMMLRTPSERADPYLGVLAYFVTFFLVGIWHGRTSEFIAFGFLQGLGISVNKLYQVLMAQVLGRKAYRSLGANPVYNAFARGLTFTYFTFSLLWFWSTWQQLRVLAAALGTPAVVVVWIAIWLGSTAMLSLWESVRKWNVSILWDGAPAIMTGPFRAAWATYLAVITAIVANSFTAATPILYQIF